MRSAVLACDVDVPATGQAVIIDCGDALDIHPKNKRDPGERLAALVQVSSGRNVAAAGPRFAGMSVRGNVARIEFTCTGDFAAHGEGTGGEVFGVEESPWAWMSFGVERAGEAWVVMLIEAALEVVGVTDVDFSDRVDKNVNEEHGKTRGLLREQGSNSP